MKILITGAKGQLGGELLRILHTGASEIGPMPTEYDGAHILAIDLDDLNIADSQATYAYFENNPVDIVINCAAMTNVDACETDREAAMLANAIGARNLALAANEANAKLVHVSTDYVFEGTGDVPFAEWDRPAPATVYGKSKLLGERYVRESCPKSFIMRTAWLYSRTGNNFVKTIVGLAENKDRIKVVNDQIGNPTNANDLAHHILKVALTYEYGIYHCTGEGICSWYDFAREIVLLSGYSCEVLPCTTEEFPRPAPRPAYSALDNLMLRSTVGDEMRHWKEALTSYFGAR